MGKNADYNIDWDDKVDDDVVFDHIKCSILDNAKVSLDEHEDPPLKVILRIYFTTSCITIQGLDHEWFSSDIFPQIKDEFNSLLASPSHVTPILPVTASVRSATSVTNDPVSDSATNNMGTTSTFFCKSPVPSRIPQPVNVFSPRQVRSPKIPHTPQMDFASLESKLTQTLQAFDKLNLENFLSSTERKFNDLVSRIQTIESKLLNTSAHKPVSSACDIDVLVKELKTLKKDLSSKTATDKELLVSKENQIDILMSELTDKTKEIEKLKKVVSAKGKNSFENDLKDTIILLNEKKTEIKCLNEDLIFTRNKLHQREQDLQLLQNNNMEANEEINLLKDRIYQKEDELDKMRIINTELQNQISGLNSVESKLAYTLKELDLIRTENDRITHVLSQKNDIIHDLLISSKSKSSQKIQEELDVTKVNDLYNEDGSDSGPKEVMLIGDSLIKQIIPDRLVPRDCDVHVVNQNAFHLEEIKSLVESSASTFKTVDVTVIHCGTNDIKEQTADACFDMMKSVVTSLHTVNPDMKVVISNIAPRGDEEIFDINRQEYNVKLLKEYSLNPKVTLCDNSNLAKQGKIINKFYGMDKVHLNEEGSKVLAANIGFSIKSVLGIKVKRHHFVKKGNHNYNNNYNRNRNPNCNGYRNGKVNGKQR